MAQLKNYNGEKRSLLYSFEHRYSFCVPNFSEIISLEMKGYRARLGRGSGREESFLWGNYDLCIFYRKFDRKKETVAEKVFARSFSVFLDTSLHPLIENPAAEKKDLICDAKYSVSVAPLFFTLFPLLAKFDYLPFKITVDVFGGIFAGPYSAPVEQEKERDRSSRPEFYRERARVQTRSAAAKKKGEGEEGVGKGEESAREKKEAAVKKTEPVARARGGKNLRAAGEDSIYLEKIYQMMEESSPGKVPRKKQETAKKNASIASTPAGLPPKTVPPGGALHPNDYDTYRLFYDYFFPEMAAKEASLKKKQDEEQKRSTEKSGYNSR